MKYKFIIALIFIAFLNLQFVDKYLETFGRIVNLPSTPYDYTTITIPTHLSVNVLNGAGQNAAIDNDNTPASNPTTNHGATLGRVLFFDKNLSANGTISCASCHKQELGFSDNKVLSLGFQGQTTRRHSMGLTNARWYKRGKFFWDERAATLEEQVLMPFLDQVEMGMSTSSLLAAVQSETFYPVLFSNAFGSTAITTDRIAKALAQYVRSIVSVSSKFDTGRAEVNIPAANFPNFTTSENNGKRLFFLPKASGGLSCVGCHSTEAFVNPDAGATNNGLDAASTTDLGVFEAIPNPRFLGTFKVPSLKNIALTAPYMHDGRFATLEAVVEHYNSGVQNHPNLNSSLKDNGQPQRLNLSASDKTDVVNFFKTLTDDDLINDIKFSDPFGSLLPIELISFSVRLNSNNEAVLEWSTSSESNNHFFVLQKSKNGSLFEDIGRVETKGESSDIQQYFFIDKSPFQNLTYYRFKQVDRDGKTFYSKINSLYKLQSEDVRIYPNPAIVDQPIVIETTSTHPLNVEIFDLLGKKVMSTTSMSNQNVDLSKLDQGIYFYKISSLDVQSSGKLLISKR
jgi:cytochrome c peroxidase